VNPELNIYAPQEGFGVFGATLPGDFYPGNEALPPEMRYFDGKPPEILTFGSAWPTAKFSWIGETGEISPGIHLIALVGNWGTDLAVRELSLAIDTPKGIVLVVGCSHPTIEKIVETAIATLHKPVHLVIGGTHLLPASASEIQRIAAVLHDKLDVHWIAPAHCTGEPAFEILQQTFADHYLYAGLGTTIGFAPDLDTPSGQTASSATPDKYDALIYRLLSAAEASHSDRQQLATQQ
jgi:7,8-dihydropterin-6-yl-methyl-4-(beta-D-ribofuranosyl)aminobenzene 5'-phosphate synthase